MTASNFDRYLDDQLRDPGFAKRFRRAGEAWDAALHIAALREQAGFPSRKRCGFRAASSPGRMAPGQDHPLDEAD